MSEDYDLKPQQHPAPPPVEPRETPVLPYRAPRLDTPTQRPGSSVGPFIIGFVASLGVCVGGFMLLGLTFEVSQPLRWVSFSVVCGAVVGLFFLRYPLQQRFGFSGFGRGVTVGVILGMMALGPCAGCYFLRLFEA